MKNILNLADKNKTRLIGISYKHNRYPTTELSRIHEEIENGFESTLIV